MLHTYIPYAPLDKEMNLGWTYNNFMSMVGEDDWVCFLDHDAMFTTRYWYHQLEEIIEKNPDIGLFSCMTNRIGNGFQRMNPVMPSTNHNIHDHRTLGNSLYKNFLCTINKYKTSETLYSGVILLTSKKVWKKVGGFKDGFLGVDNDYHQRCIDSGLDTALMPGVYVYHWYRGDGDKEHLQRQSELF